MRTPRRPSGGSKSSSRPAKRASSTSAPTTACRRATIFRADRIDLPLPNQNFLADRPLGVEHRRSIRPGLNAVEDHASQALDLVDFTSREHHGAPGTEAVLGRAVSKEALTLQHVIDLLGLGVTVNRGGLSR